MRSASRMDYFAHAEAFAALVNMEFVLINGAITTIITLLKKPETRCAAVTMLGKTVELCLQQLTEKCDPGVLQDLNNALQNVNEDAFQYDINYIEESMGDSRTTIQTASREGGGLQSSERVCYYDINASSSFGNLTPVRQYTGHEELIPCLALLPPIDNLFLSGSQDSSVRVWDRRLDRCVGEYSVFDGSPRNIRFSECQQACPVPDP